MSKQRVNNGITYNFPDDATEEEINEHFRARSYVETQITQPIKNVVTDVKDFAKNPSLEFLRPLIMGAATGVGTAIGQRTGFPQTGTVAGAGAGFLMDQAAQLVQGKELGGESLLESGKMLAVQEAAPVITNPILKFGKGLLAAKAGVAPETIDQAVYNQLGKFKATYSQYLGSPVSKFIEDVFAAGTKKKRLEEQGKLAVEAGEEYVSNLSGRPLTLGPHAFGKALQSDIKENFTKSIQESNFNAKIAEGIGNTNVSQVITGYKIEPPTLFSPGSTTPIIKNISGPIELSNATIYELKEMLNVLSAPNVTPRQRDFANQINKLLSENTVKDQTGNVTGFNPIPFREAWNFKQAADIYGYERKELGTEVTQARNISKSFNDDITSGIKKWGNNSSDALRAWENSKAIVAQREQLFGRKDAPNVYGIRTTANSIVKSLDEGLKDPSKLKRILISGEVGLPTGKVLNSNARKDYQGYALGRILQEGWESTSTIDPSEGHFIAKKLFDAWRDPVKQESLELLYSKATRAEISNFLEAVSRVSSSQNPAGKIAANIRIGGAGITLGAGLLSKGLEFVGTPSGRYTGAIIGASLGLNAVGRILSNPVAARYLINIVESKPLDASQRFALKMIMNTLQGTEMVLDMRDGTKVPGKIVKGGKFVPAEMPNP